MALKFMYILMIEFKMELNLSFESDKMLSIMENYFDYLSIFIFHLTIWFIIDFESLQTNTQ